MPDIDVTVRGIAVYSCRSEGDDETPDRIGVYEGDELEEDEDGREVHSIVERMLERDALKKRYGKRKNARVHQWNDGDPDDEDTSKSTADLFEEIRRGENLEAASETLAAKYIAQERSVEDLLLTTRYSHNGRDFSAVLKTPYLDRVREIDVRSATITENDHVIEATTDKSVLYPEINYEGELDETRARVYQKNGASNWANYWYRFVGLDNQEVSDEKVERKIRNRAMESSDGVAFDSYQDFQEEVDGLFEDESYLQGEIQLSIGDHRQFRVSLRELAEEDDVVLARNGNEIYVILKGATPTVTVGSGESSKKTVFDDFEGVRELSEVIDELA